MAKTKANHIDKQIGSKLEFHRKLRSKKREWLAKKIGVTFQQIRNYEIGRTKITASCLFVMSNLLKFDIANFFPNDKLEK